MHCDVLAAIKRSPNRLVSIVQYPSGPRFFLDKFSQRLNILDVISIVGDCLAGLSYLHESGIMHRDIKCENVLLEVLDIPGEGRKLKAKLCDFGLAKLLSQSTHQRNHTANRGSPLYWAPEVELGKYDISCDVYALGVAFVELFCNVAERGHEFDLAAAGSFHRHRLACLNVLKLTEYSVLFDVLSKLTDPRPLERPRTAVLRSTIIPLLQEISAIAASKDREDD
eukprot:ANDGO_06882.mRNA.1 putative serine/threonine-protein kinase DDB_G0267514